MNFLGLVTLTPGDGTVLAIGSTTPEIGDTVFDSRKKKVGSVKRVFGPVGSPYVSIKLNEKTVAEGEELYYAKEGKHGIKRKTRN